MSLETNLEFEQYEVLKVREFILGKVYSYIDCYRLSYDSINATKHV